MSREDEGIWIGEANIGRAHAELEQVRSESLDILRESEVFTVMALSKDRSHCRLNSFCMHEKEILPFFAMNAVRGIQALAAVIERDVDETIEYVRQLIEGEVDRPTLDEE